MSYAGYPLSPPPTPLSAMNLTSGCPSNADHPAFQSLRGVAPHSMPVTTPGGLDMNLDMDALADSKRKLKTIHP